MEVKQMWSLARDGCCDNCSHSRGCTQPCQLLRNTVTQMSKNLPPKHDDLRGL